MEPHSDDSLKPALQEAKETLSEALSEACSVNVLDADTGELIKVEEMLAIAGDAAKQIVSIRRKLGGRKPTAKSTPAAGSLGDIGVNPADAHRTFEDEFGVTWDAFAVYPSEGSAARAQLPEPYNQGWLSFDSGAEKRRLSPIPQEWPNLSDGQLRVLCGRAELVRGRVRTSGESRGE